MISEHIMRDLATYKSQCQTNMECRDDLRGDRYAAGCTYGTELCIRAANLASDTSALYGRISKLSAAWEQKSKMADVTRGDAFVLGICNALLWARRILAAHRGIALIGGKP